VLLARVRRSIIPIFIAVASVLCLVLGWRVFGRDAIERYQRVRLLEKQPSEIRLSMTVRYARGAIAEEEYRMVDLNGLSSVSYRVAGRSGTSVRVEGLPYASYDVSSFFGQTVQDGIWELRDAPPRGDTTIRYSITIAQTVDGRQGTHTMWFTDPHYWATTAGRQYRIRLEKDKPVPDVLFLRGTSIAQPRYQRLVDDFREFGSDAFHAKVAAARKRAEGGSQVR
jgi:hypothetical protein